jgi:hypothetical protein
VHLDFSLAVNEGKFVVSNKPGRIKDVIAFVHDIIREGKISAAALDKLRGRIQFIESFVFGKLARFILGPFSMTVRARNRALVWLDESMK